MTLKTVQHCIVRVWPLHNETVSCKLMKVQMVEINIANRWDVTHQLIAAARVDILCSLIPSVCFVGGLRFVHGTTFFKF